jgi:hypothetical protein
MGAARSRAREFGLDLAVDEKFAAKSEAGARSWQRGRALRAVADAYLTHGSPPRLLARAGLGCSRTDRILAQAILKLQ